MRVVIQRVIESSVTIDGNVKGKIGKGLMILVGFEATDTQEDIDWISYKIVNLRIFPDANGVMNVSILDADGEVLIISQFTLMASTKKGNRPSYIHAAPPDISIPLYEAFLKKMDELLPHKVQSGIFGADMKVALINDGPVTILIDSKNRY
ncbi:MAG: D-tyrosyl-tRNA(Tyr) deacylase [Bacteroidales bacterium]|nr:D-tyrosyl-tRNA(Tyr) deacylase [Bacteroidales bacterium]MBR5651007.1 D-tyrosyl-tRNA(Tyr) deacylase [Bacteroidales bacterium]